MTAPEWILFNSPTDDGSMKFSSKLPEFQLSDIGEHQADAHWGLIDQERIVARCSLWWTNTPSYQHHRTGLIGHFAAKNSETAGLLLEYAVHQLTEQHCTLAIGPMDQNSWRNYRLVIESTAEPSFVMEPQNPSDWPQYFLDNHFEEFATYFSAIVSNLNVASPRLQQVQSRMVNRGVTFRPLSKQTFHQDLTKIHSVARVAFRDHLLYSDIPETVFTRQYEAWRDLVPTDLIWLAEQEHRTVAFCFALPDLSQAARGKDVDTVIIKTLGVLPERQFAGLGQLLLEFVQQRAAEMGYRRGIHALVREVPILQKISGRYAVPFRRYALFARELNR